MYRRRSRIPEGKVVSVVGWVKSSSSNRALNQEEPSGFRLSHSIPSVPDASTCSHCPNRVGTARAVARRVRRTLRKAVVSRDCKKSVSFQCPIGFQGFYHGIMRNRMGFKMIDHSFFLLPVAESWFRILSRCIFIWPL